MLVKADEAINTTVKFKINEFETIAQVYPNNFTIANVLKDIAQKFQLSTKHLSIQREDCTVIPSVLCLHEICQNEFSIVNFRLVLTDLAKCVNSNAATEYEKLKLDADVYYRHYQLPDFISVFIPSDGDVDEVRTGRRLIVEVDNNPIVKPFIGGFRNKLTGIEYHHAFTQTGPIFDRIKWSGMLSRDTQTTESRYVNTQESIDRQVQVDPLKPGQLIKGYVIKPRKEKYDASKIILIQRNFRRYLWQQLIRSSALEWRKIKAEQLKLEQDSLDQSTKNEDLLIENVRNRGDFEKLLAQVQQWKDSEIKHINEQYSGGARLAELKLLLDEEITLLNNIGRQRLKIQRDLEQIKTERELDKLGAPVKWRGYKNIICHMDLLQTQRIRELTLLHRSLRQITDKSERTEFLIKLCGKLKKLFPPTAVQNLIDLLMEEKNLLAIDVHAEALEELRQRQTVCFVNLIKAEQVYKPRSTKKQPCQKCGILRTTSDFELSTRQNDKDICKSCHKLETLSIDSSPYKTMLNAIRRAERKRNALTSCAFVMQPDDIREIVETIWHGHSILSQCSDRNELRLPRWDKTMEWSPWNCICLTKTETLVHLKVKSMQEVYESSLIAAIKSNHQLAKIIFNQEKKNR